MTPIRRTITTALFIAMATAVACARHSDTEEPAGRASPSGQAAQAVGEPEQTPEPEHVSPSGHAGHAVPPGEAPAVGARAAGGTVRGADGSSVDLASLWQERPTVIIFYRGHWCGYCQQQFQAIEQKRAEVEALGAGLVAISAAADDPAEMKAKAKVGFPLYSDPELATIQAWGVLDAESSIARPAIFVVDRDGTISYAYVGKDKSDRPAFDEVLAALRKLDRQG